MSAARAGAALALAWLLAGPARAQEAGAEGVEPTPAPAAGQAPVGSADDSSEEGSTSGTGKPSPPAAAAADAPQAGPPEDARDQAVFGGEVPGDQARDADVFGEPRRDDARDADVFGEPAADDAGRDAAMFGETTLVGENEASAEAAATSRDEAMLGDPDRDFSASTDAAPSDPLTLGGLMYLRMQSFILQDQPAEDWSFTVPTLAQLYFDVRPNERVRGFAQVRLQFDPTLPASQEQRLGSGASLAPGGASDGVQDLSSVFQSGTRDVRFVFDQLWINFDINYRVFVTAGKQHDRWGTARFWMPTDYLHLQNRNPINVFDSRAGTNMLKLHFPVESLAWNFYAYAITEDPLEATDAWGKIAGAFRAEFVFGHAELGLGIFGRSGELPRFAADLSFGLWDLDFYGELAVRDASVVDRVRADPDAPIPPPEPPPSWQTPEQTALAAVQQVVDARYPVYQQRGMKTQVVGGLSYQANYDDDDVLTLGFEYFFNDLGYYSYEHYPGLVLPHSTPLNNPATFFYLGKHYLAGFLLLPSPFAADLHTFTFSTLGNLADLSFISRLDYSYTLLTHVTLEAFFAVHYGTRRGEFRFGTEELTVYGQTVPAQPPSLVDLGLALRLEF